MWPASSSFSQTRAFCDYPPNCCRNKASLVRRRGSNTSFLRTGSKTNEKEEEGSSLFFSFWSKKFAFERPAIKKKKESSLMLYKVRLVLNIISTICWMYSSSSPSRRVESINLYISSLKRENQAWGLYNKLWCLPVRRKTRSSAAVAYRGRRKRSLTERGFSFFFFLLKGVN